MNIQIFENINKMVCNDPQLLNKIGNSYFASILSRKTTYQTYGALVDTIEKLSGQYLALFIREKPNERAFDMIPIDNLGHGYMDEIDMPLFMGENAKTPFMLLPFEDKTFRVYIDTQIEAIFIEGSWMSENGDEYNETAHEKDIHNAVQKLIHDSLN